MQIWKKQKSCIIMLTGLLLAGSLFGLDLVKDGKAISGVITDGTNPSLPLALEELLTYTKKVTGADLASAENPGIVIATLDSKLVPPGVREKLEAASEDEAFCLKTSDGKLYIIGKTGVGALYGTYELIEKHLGVRWFLPGEEEGERWEAKKDIVLPDMDEFHSPAFRYRILNQVSSHGLAREGRVWAARNRFASPGPWGIGDTLVKYRDFHEPRMILKRTSTGGHLTFELAVPTKQYATEHPEYFALVDGQRRTTGAHLHHCISNPEVQELLYQYIIRHFEKYGVENTSYLFGAPDTLQGWCECQECRNLDGGDGRNVSRRFHLVSQKIAKRVWEKFPDAELWVWAYWNYRDLPEDVEIDPRTVVYFCSHARCYAHALNDASCPRNVAVLEILKKWMRVNKNIFIYEYGMAVPYNYEPYEEVMFEDMKFYKQLGLLGRKEEMIYPDASFAAIPSLKNDPWKSTLSMGSKWQFWHLLGRAAFNPDRDAAKEIAEAERLFYGKTYPAMKKYNDLRRELWKNTPGCIGFPYGDNRTPLILQKPGAKEELLALLDEAGRLAEGNTVLENRIALERGYLEHFWIETNAKYRLSLGRRISAPTAVKAPVIDGQANDPTWGRAFYVTDFRSALDEKATPIPPELATSVGILSDKENLYFIIEAKEPNTAELKADGTDFSGIWGDDMVEIFLAPQNNAQKYYQFAVNTKGTVVELEQPGNNKEVSFGASAKATVRADGYTIELKIPTRKLEGVFAPGASWKVHAARNRKVRDALPATGWSIDGAGYHALLDYRTMNIGDPLLRNGSFEEGTQENGSPKSWGRNGKNQGELVALPNGGHAFKLVPGGDLRQIPYGKLFRPKKPIKIEVSFRASGSGVLYVSNARFNQERNDQGKTVNKFIGTENAGKFNLVPEEMVYSCEYTILADEFTQLIFGVHGKDSSCLLDDVSIIEKP